jgi:hypothetical protein
VPIVLLQIRTNRKDLSDRFVGKRPRRPPTRVPSSKKWARLEANQEGRGTTVDGIAPSELYVLHSRVLNPIEGIRNCMLYTSHGQMEILFAGVRNLECEF